MSFCGVTFLDSLSPQSRDESIVIVITVQADCASNISVLQEITVDHCDVSEFILFIYLISKAKQSNAVSKNTTVDKC